MEALDLAVAFIAQETGKKVLLDPQPLRTAEPHLRLTFVGATEQGDGYVTLSFQLGIVGAGDGPEVFLEEIINSSVAVMRLYGCKRFKDLRLTTGNTARLAFPDVMSNSGQFAQNEGTMGETVQ
jgi:hypothetical protein